MTRLMSSSIYTSRYISIEALNMSVSSFAHSLTAVLVFCSKQIPFCALPKYFPCVLSCILIPASSFRLVVLHSANAATL